MMHGTHPRSNQGLINIIRLIIVFVSKISVEKRRIHCTNSDSEVASQAFESDIISTGGENQILSSTQKSSEIESNGYFTQVPFPLSRQVCAMSRS